MTMIVTAPKQAHLGPSKLIPHPNAFWMGVCDPSGSPPIPHPNSLWMGFLDRGTVKRHAHAFLSGSPQGRGVKSSSDWASIILTPMARRDDPSAGCRTFRSKRSHRGVHPCLAQNGATPRSCES